MYYNAGGKNPIDNSDFLSKKKQKVLLVLFTHLDRFSSNNPLLLPKCDAGSTGLHCTCSRSDHAQKTFQMIKEVALTGHDILVDSILGHASLLTFVCTKSL